jgi:hypothetical protein
VLVVVVLLFWVMCWAEGSALLRELCLHKTVGVWGYAKKDPDDVETAKRFMDIGVNYVNTDLPKEFV